VKNNLQVISSLLRLQSRYIADDAYKRMFLEGQSRLDSMVLIHELLYRSDNLARVDVRGYITGIARLLFSSFGVGLGRIQFQADVEPVSMSVDTAIPCGLIVNELVSNSLEHAFPDANAGVIRVALRADHDEFDLAVGDTGVGFPDDLDIEKAETLGLRLVHTLVKQLQGEIALRRSRGTEFHVRFKEMARTSRGTLLADGALR
jgi:two-component sensor histidine kinase